MLTNLRERMALEEVEDPHHLKINEYGEDKSAVEMVTKKVGSVYLCVKLWLLVGCRICHMYTHLSRHQEYACLCTVQIRLDLFLISLLSSTQDARSKLTNKLTGFWQQNTNDSDADSYYHASEVSSIAARVSVYLVCVCKCMCVMHVCTCA